jgi:hypothetical protein
LPLKLPGITAKTISGLDGCHVSDKMFACISGKGVGLRLSVAVATELEFSRDDVVPFRPGGASSTREWIQMSAAPWDTIGRTARTDCQQADGARSAACANAST